MVARSRSFPIASINLLRDQKDHDHVMHDLMKVRRTWPRAKIIGAQEGKQYRDVLEAVPGMRLALPRGVTGDKANNPILYDPDELHLLTCIVTQVHGGKAGQYPARNFTTGMFRWDVDGSVLFYNNTQVNSHIEKDGHPRDLPRTPLSSAHLRTMADTVKGDAKGYSLAFLGGDLNVDEDADNRVDWSGFPNQIFRERDIESIYDELDVPASFDTLGHRKIDAIASYKGDRRVKGRKVARIDSANLYTDHAAICAWYDIRVMR